VCVCVYVWLVIDLFDRNFVDDEMEKSNPSLYYFWGLIECLLE